MSARSVRNCYGVRVAQGVRYSQAAFDISQTASRRFLASIFRSNKVFLKIGADWLAGSARHTPSIARIISAFSTATSFMQVHRQKGLAALGRDSGRLAHYGIMDLLLQSHRELRAALKLARKQLDTRVKSGQRRRLIEIIDRVQSDAKKVTVDLGLSRMPQSAVERVDRPGVTMWRA